MLAAAYERNALRLWEVATGKEIVPTKGHSGYIVAAAISPDGLFLATAGYNGTVCLWDLVSGHELRRLSHHPDSHLAPGHLIFSPDGRLLACGGGGGWVTVWETSMGNTVRQFQAAKQGGVYGMTFSPSGKVLAMSGWESPAGAGTTAKVDLWDWATGRKLETLRDDKGPHATVGWLAFMPDGKSIIVGGMALGRLDAATGKRVQSFDIPGQQRGRPALSPDGRFVTVGCWDRILRSWDIASGKQVQAVDPTVGKQLRAIDPRIGDAPMIAYSPIGDTLASAGSDRVIHLWNMTTGKEGRRLQGSFASISALMYTPDGGRLVTGHKDTTLLLWDVGREDVTAPVPSPEELARLWKDLAEDDSTKAFRAMRALSAAPKRTVRFLDNQLRPVAVDTQRVDRLVAELGSNSLEIRQKATAELEQLADLAGPALEKALTGKPTLEFQQRVEHLLAKLSIYKVPSPQLLQALRAIQVLEQIGTADARQVLETLTGGADGAKLTREAKVALQRLKQRQ
jgi:WD40 repeat protein